MAAASRQRSNPPWRLPKSADSASPGGAARCCRLSAEATGRLAPMKCWRGWQRLRAARTRRRRPSIARSPFWSKTALSTGSIRATPSSPASGRTAPIAPIFCSARNAALRPRLPMTGSTPPFWPPPARRAFRSCARPWRSPGDAAPAGIAGDTRLRLGRALRRDIDLDGMCGMFEVRLVARGVGDRLKRRS